MNIFDLPLWHGKYADFLALIQQPAGRTLVFTPNPEILYRAHFDPEFMQILQHATYNVPDGNGLYVAEMMQAGRGFFASCLRVFLQKRSVYEAYGELIKGSDLTRDILEAPLASAGKKRKILIIDRKNTVPKNDFERQKAEIQKNLGSILEEKFPNNEFFVVFDGEKTPAQIAEMITEQDITFVFSCIGMKTQEERLVEIFSHIPESFPVVGMGVGASIDFLLGLQKRAPKVFRDLGFEWLYRLITQPKIRYKRIKTALIDFPRLVKREVRNTQN